MIAKECETAFKLRLIKSELLITAELELPGSIALPPSPPPPPPLLPPRVYLPTPPWIYSTTRLSTYMQHSGGSQREGKGSGL